MKTWRGRRMSKNKNGELAEASVSSILEHTAADGKIYKTNELRKYSVIQDTLMESDFDKAIKKQLAGTKNE